MSSVVELKTGPEGLFLHGKYKYHVLLTYHTRRDISIYYSQFVTRLQTHRDLPTWLSTI